MNYILDQWACKHTAKHDWGNLITSPHKQKVRMIW